MQNPLAPTSAIAVLSVPVRLDGSVVGSLDLLLGLVIGKGWMVILALPFMNSTDPDDQQELQDPTTGQFFFMSGIDAAGDPAAPVHG
jgi:hypothetical protein